jgi:hypothetical protein
MPPEKGTPQPDRPNESASHDMSTTEKLSLLAVTGIGVAAMAVGGRYIRPLMAAARMLKGVEAAEAVTSDSLLQATTQASGLRSYLSSLNPDARKGLVFERFLARAPQPGAESEYALQGSYRLKLTGDTKRIPDDVDFIRVDPKMSLMQGSRTATTDALHSELKTTFGKDLADGFSFEIPRIITRPAYWMYPAMRQAEVIAKADGQEVMRFTTGVRMQPRTMLPTEQLQVPSIVPGMPPLQASALAKEEILGRKLFSIQKSLVVTRGPKDIFDVANLIRNGVDDSKVLGAMQAFYERGFSLSAMSNRAPWSMRMLQGTSRMKGQTAEEFQNNYATISNYFNDRILPTLSDKVANAEYDTSIAARLRRAFFSRSAYFVY